MYTLRVGPFSNTKNLTLNFLKIREVFPESFIYEEFKKSVSVPRVVEKTVYVEKEDETFGGHYLD